MAKTATGNRKHTTDGFDRCTTSPPSSQATETCMDLESAELSLLAQFQRQQVVGSLLTHSYGLITANNWQDDISQMRCLNKVEVIHLGKDNMVLLIHRCCVAAATFNM